MNKEMTKEKNIDINKIETIFDHNITQEELENSYITFTKSKEDYLKDIENDYYKNKKIYDDHIRIYGKFDRFYFDDNFDRHIIDVCYHDIYDLYYQRKDYKTAKKYFYMQSAKALKWFGYATVGDAIKAGVYTGDIEINGVTL